MHSFLQKFALSAYAQNRVLLALLIALMLSLGANAAFASTNTPDAPDAPTIVGGRDAKLGEVPWQALVYPPGALCGGSLIHPEWVISAAHCFPPETGVGSYEEYTTTVILGIISRTANFKQKPQAFKVNSKNIFKHPEYKGVYLGKDLVLLKLPKPAVLGIDVQTVGLVGSVTETMPITNVIGITNVSGLTNTKVITGTPVITDTNGITETEVITTYRFSVTASGWGATKARRESDPKGNAVNRLQVAEMPFVDWKTCDEAYKRTSWHNIPQDTICAGFVLGGVDTCQGDSGGPLVQKLYDGTWVLRGITSYGSGCAQPEKYGVYADPIYHIDWILEITDLSLLSFEPRELKIPELLYLPIIAKE